jgi:hypothetical protein
MPANAPLHQVEPLLMSPEVNLKLGPTNEM